MLSLAHHYDEPVAVDGVTYRARVYSAPDTDGRWGGWIVFFPVGGGRVIATSRETTQSSLADLSYWAAGLTHTYLHGALRRALALQPEEQLARELERLERLEEEANVRAEALDEAASLARTETRLAEAARERTEEELLAAVADAAETEAEAQETSAELSRLEAQAARRTLRARHANKPTRSVTSSRKKSSKKKR